MEEKRIGRVVFSERGYIVAEVLAAIPERSSDVTGFLLIGPLASDSIIYGSRMQALEALQDIEARTSDN